MYQLWIYGFPMVFSPIAELAALDCASPATERNPRDCCRFRKAGDLPMGGPKLDKMK